AGVVVKIFRLLLCALLQMATVVVEARAADITWSSSATGTDLRGKIFVPANSTAPMPTVVYLKNLSIPRLGQEAYESIIDDLVKSGHLVLMLDYAHHAKAVSPDLYADLLKLRADIADAKKKNLLID